VLIGGLYTGTDSRIPVVPLHHQLPKFADFAIRRFRCAASCQMRLKEWTGITLCFMLLAQAGAFCASFLTLA